MQFDRAVDSYLRHVAIERGLSQNTVAAYRRDLAGYAEWLRDQGIGMIFVSHRLDEVFQIADRVVVLRDGSLVGDHPVASMDADQLVYLIVGRAPERLFAKATSEAGGRLLEVRGMRVEGGAPLDFTVDRGEIVGLVGLRGAGQENVGRALFGGRPFAGEVTLAGAAYQPSGPKAAIAAGVGLIARERTEESTFPSLSIRENAFANPGAMGRSLFAVLPPWREAELATRLGRYDTCEVILVDRDPSHFWKPRLHELAAGLLGDGEEAVPFLAHGTTHGYRYEPGAIRHVDVAAKQIDLAEVHPTVDERGVVLAQGLLQRRVPGGVGRVGLQPTEECWESHPRRLLHL